MENVTFYDFEKAPRGNRIPGRKVRLHNKPGNRTITFSSECGKEIGCIPAPKLRIAENNLTGEIYLVINSEKGVEIKGNNKKSASSPTVYSKQVVDFILSKLSLALEGGTIDIEISKNLANQSTLLTYRLTKS